MFTEGKLSVRESTAAPNPSRTIVTGYGTLEIDNFSFSFSFKSLRKLIFLIIDKYSITGSPEQDLHSG